MNTFPNKCRRDQLKVGLFWLVFGFFFFLECQNTSLYYTLVLSEVERCCLCPLTTCEACLRNGVSLERKGWWSACARLDLKALERIIPQHSAVMPSIMSLCSGTEGAAERFSRFSSLIFQELSWHSTWAGIFNYAVILSKRNIDCEPHLSCL